MLKTTSEITKRLNLHYIVPLMKDPLERDHYFLEPEGGLSRVLTSKACRYHKLNSFKIQPSIATLLKI